jgi:hypothetical protein
VAGDQAGRGHDGAAEPRGAGGPDARGAAVDGRRGVAVEPDAGRGAGQAVLKDRSWAWALLLAALLLAAFPYAEQTRNANERPRLLQGIALVEDGVWRIDGRGLDPGPDTARDPRSGAVFPNKPPGASVAAAAAYAGARAWAGARGEPLTLRAYTWWARALAGALPTLLLCAWMVRRYAAAAATGPVLLAVGAYVLATPAVAYAHLLYGHALTACLLAVGTGVTIDALRRDAPAWAALGGATAAASVAVEYSAAFAGAPLAVFAAATAVRGRWRAAVGAAVGAALPLTLLGLYHAHAFGSPLKTGYHHAADPGFAAKHGQGLLGLVAPSWQSAHAHLLSSQAGLLWWAPLAVLGLAGLWDMARRTGDSPLRDHARVGLAGFVALALACASLNFEGGWRVGPRYLVAALPALALGWAHALGWVVGPGRAAWRALGFAALLTWSAVIDGLAANLWPHFDLTNVHQPVSEVLLPLWRAGRAPYLAFGVGVTAVVGLGLAGLLWLLVRAGATRRQRAAVAVGVALGLAMVAATRWIPPHPRAAANLAYIEKVWEPPARGAAASAVLVDGRVEGPRARE